jgi:hypothetical protein
MVLRQAEEKIAGVRIDVLDAGPLSAMEGEILPVPDIRAKLDLGARPDRLLLLWHGIILARTLYSNMHSNDRWIKRHPDVHFQFTPTGAFLAQPGPSWLPSAEIRISRRARTQPGRSCE